MRIFWGVLFFGLSLDGLAFASENPWIYHEKIIQSPAYSEISCEATLQSLTEAIDAVDWSKSTNEELKQNAAAMIQDSWQLRLLLHSRLLRGGKPCALQIRNIFHKLRDYEDYLSEFAYPTTPLDPKTLDFQSQPVPIFDRKAYPGFLVRKEFNQAKFPFASGDLMLARGVSFVSAIITQVSDNQSHFSHVVTVHVDEKGEEASTVESYIGSGVSKFTLPFALKNENARLLVLRPKNQTFAKAAAEIALTTATDKLPYDYQMDFVDSKAMSCVEVPIFSYAKASGGAMQLPAYPASVKIKNVHFLNRMGLREGILRTPDDLEVDPNFEMLADWKDMRLLRDSRHKDALLSEMVRWISDLHYDFHDNLKSYLAMYFIKPARSTFFWPWIQKWTNAPNIDEEVPRSTLGVMVLMDQVGETLLAKLRSEDAAYFAEHKRPMTNQQLRKVLEDYRVQDLQNYQDNSSSDFHQILRAEAL